MQHLTQWFVSVICKASLTFPQTGCWLIKNYWLSRETACLSPFHNNKKITSLHGNISNSYLTHYSILRKKVTAWLLMTTCRLLLYSDHLCVCVPVKPSGCLICRDQSPPAVSHILCLANSSIWGFHANQREHVRK